MASLVDQLEEIEALESIFPDCFTKISIKEPIQYKIRIVPNSEGCGENHVGVSLVCKLPSGYPNTEVPGLTVEIDKGLSKKQGEELDELAKSMAAENIGNPSIFTIAEGIKDWLASNNVPGQDGSMYADMMRRMQQKDTEVKKKIVKEELIKNSLQSLENAENNEIAIDKEEQERLRKRALGTLVTPESFALWKKKFDEEMKQDVLTNPNRPAGSYCPVNATLVAPTVTFSHSKTIFNFAVEPPAPADSAAAQDLLNNIQARPTGKQLFIMNKAIGEFAYLEDNTDLLEEGIEKALEQLNMEEEEDGEDEDYVDNDENSEDEEDDDDYEEEDA